MARTDTLANYITDISNAVREKTGKTDLIKANELDTEIASIEAGVDINDYFESELKSGSSYGSGLAKAIKKIPDYMVLPEDCTYLFSRCEGIEELPLFDASHVTNMSYFCNHCKSLTKFPALNTQNVQRMNNMFQYCTKLTEIPLLNTSQVTNMSYMFSDSGITSIPFLDTSQVTDMSNMFMRANKLKTIPQFDMQNVTTLSMFFYGDGVLEEIPSLNTVKVTTLYSAFYSQKNLHTVGLLDGTSLVNVTTTFSNCSSLTNFGGIKDLGKAYLTTSNENYNDYTLSLNDCNNLTHDSLMNVINNLYDIKTAGCKNQKLLLGSTNLAKLTEDEIAIATNKG